MLELIDRVGRVAHHVFDGVLVAEPVRPLHGVVHVPAPIVRVHVAERGRDAALRRNGVRAGREHLGDAGGAQARFRAADHGAQARAAGADHDDVVGVVLDRIGLAVGGRAAIGGLAVSFTGHGSNSRRQFEDCVDRGQCDRDAEEVVRHHAGDLQLLIVDVVFDHDLHADLHVPGAGDDEEQQDDGDRDRAEDLRCAGMVAADQHDHHDDHGDDQQRHRNCGEALTPEIGGAGMRGAKAADAFQRRAHRGRAAHRPPPTA
ncbi:hypothetical protein chiPu_0028048 [Chiloscyllium punctatum]|uniref:Uncharacterized protein n=1 Tax=Chiloscyllium punctatum TaxID=137246 RepID=A0A401TN97_CHIPU|nr:hypothetical protein [Chiloscyllium punctatum]